MRLTLLLFLLNSLLIASTQGRFCGDNPAYYYQFQNLPYGIMQYTWNDSLDGELTSFEEILGVPEYPGRCYLYSTSGDTTKYEYFYEEDYTPSQIKVTVKRDGRWVDYMMRDYLYYSGESDTARMTEYVSLIPGTFMEKSRKEVRYKHHLIPKLYDSVVTVEMYQWMPPVQASGYWRLKERIETAYGLNRNVILEINSDSTDTISTMLTFNEDGDSLLWERGRADSVFERIEWSYDGSGLTERQLSLLDSTTKEMVVQNLISVTALDGATTVVEELYDTTSKSLVSSKKEVHRTLVNPEIEYYRFDSIAEEYSKYRKDVLVYDTTAVPVQPITDISKVFQAYNLLIEESVITLYTALPVLSMEITLLNGRTLRHIPVMRNGAEHRADLSSLASGVYFLSIDMGSEKVQQLIRLD